MTRHRRTPALRTAAIAIVALLMAATVSFFGLGIFVYLQTSQLSSPTSASSDARTPAKTSKKIEQVAAENNAKAEFYDVTASRDGHRIPVLSFAIDGNLDRDTVVLLHGLGGNKEGVTRIADMYLKFGYNVLAIDQMNHGFNTAHHNMMGVGESEETLDVLTHVAAHQSGDKKLALWGMSYGGETAALTTAKAPTGMLDYVVLDSPLLEGRDKVRRVLGKDMSPKSPFFRLASSSGEMVWKLRQGIDYADMDATMQLYQRQNELPPILVIQSRQDKTIEPHMADRLKDTLGDRVQVQWTDGGHAAYSATHTEQYRMWLAEFLEEPSGGRP
ncbi:alpha/beta hydrolase [Corynebacterium ulceribovis]|uniref:alpha/beta hydrolase n=1 Tax=Corynebacterium ulceribovis TaxID=487732 RepID=UPI0003A589F0|nr:alpha/beta fold hydrolase [Corynebacterium ulceribovis]